MKVVLVVDDEPGVRDALALLLELEGFEVATAARAAEAIESARTLRPSAVVCDLGLGPGGDGCAVARAVRATPGLEATRLIALSGADQAGDRARAVEAGFAAFLLKPVEPAELLRELAGGATAES
jgi:CheY-like chemotaxis protein